MFMFQGDARLDFAVKHRSDRGNITSLPILEGDVGVCDASAIICSQSSQGRDVETGIP